MRIIRLCLLLISVGLVAAEPSAPTTPAAAAPTPRRDFVAVLTGAKVLPSTASTAEGRATFRLSADGAQLRYRVTVTRIERLSAIAIRVGDRDTVGDAVAFLFGPQYVPAPQRGQVAEGVLMARDLVGPMAGATSLNELVRRMRAQTVYVDIDTPAYRRGELRGQIHQDRAR